MASRPPLSQHPRIQHETHCRDRRRPSLALFRGRGASSLRDRHLLRRERPPVRKPHGFRGEIQLRRNDGRTPDAAFRHGTGGAQRRPVDPGHGDRSRSVHRCVPGSIAGGCERARLPLHPSQRERDGRANGIRRDRRRGPRPSTRRRCGSDAAVLPAGGGRHGSGCEGSDPQWPWLLLRATTVVTGFASRTDPSTSTIRRR